MRLSVSSLAVAALLYTAAASAQFSSGPNPITGSVNTTRTLNSGTGTISSSGTVSTGSSVGVNVTGTSTLNNDGTIQTTSGRAIDSNSSIFNLTVTNNGFIKSTSSDAFRVNSNSTVLLNNYGTIEGAQALDWAASASSTLNNYTTGTITGVNSDAVRLGTSGTVTNNGTIQTTGSGNRAIDSDSGSAGNFTVTNTGTISSVSSDAFRVNNAGSSVTLTNSGTIQVTNGGQAIDWAAIASGANTLDNLLNGIITAVGEDAVRPGNNGIVNNAGLIAATPTGTSSPSGSDGIDLRTNRIVTVNNTGTITGRHGIATDGANGTDDDGDIVGVPSSLTVNNNAGSIQAVNGSGINVDGAYASVVAIVNNALGATIKGGVLAAATEADGDGIDVDGLLTLQNHGDILGLGAKGASNNAEGIAAGGGSIFNSATGRIIGSTLTAMSEAPNGDPSKAGNGILIDNSDNGNAVAATTVTNEGLIQGKSGFGIKFIGNFADTITNIAGGTIRGAGTGAAIQTGGGADTVTNRGSVISDIGNAINLEDGDDQLIVEGNNAVITGNVSGGAGANTVKLNLGAGNSFSYAGVLSNFDTVEVQSGTTTLSGANTYSGQTVVSGGMLILDGAGRVASSSALVLDGGTLKLDNAGGPNGQTFASLSLTGDSTIDLALSSLSFGALGTSGEDDTLTILNWDAATSPGYAIRFLGNVAGSTFFTLLSGTTINGLAANYNFDGTYTNVNAVPLPAAGVLFLSGLGLFGAMGRRRRNAALAVPA